MSLIDPDSKVRKPPRSHYYLRSDDFAMAGSVSERLVAVATAESGVSSDRRWVLFIIEAACLPGAEYNSERLYCTSGCRGGQGRILSFGPSSSCISSFKCHPEGINYSKL